MELFTKSLSTDRLVTFIKNKLRVESVTVKKFDNINNMDWIYFTFDNININLIHHQYANRLSFTGSLLSFKLQEGVPLVHFERYSPTLEKLTEDLLAHLGGTILLGDEVVQSQDAENREDTDFLVNRLVDSGIDLTKLNNLLESELNKIEISRKSN